MKQNTLRRIDAFVGVLLCALLTAHRRLWEALGLARRPQDAPKKILFIKLIEQGATVLAWDAIQRAAARVGRENVYFVVFGENRAILDIMEAVPPQNVLVIRNQRLTTLALDCLLRLRDIRRLGIDTTIDMEWFSRGSAIFAYLTGASRRVGLHRFTEAGPYRGDLLTHRLMNNPFLHVARAYSHLVDALDANPDDLPLLKIPIPRAPEEPPPFASTAEATAKVQALLDQLAGGKAKGPFVILNPNASDLLPLRKWPQERFAELGRRLLQDLPEVTVLVTGAPSEKAAADELSRAIDSPRVLNVAGRTTLREVMVLYTLADVLVTNDSGPGHFSAMTPVESVVLFGPASPKQFGPLGTHCHPLTAELACSPCANVYNHRRSPCSNNVCMQSITVDQVYAQVRSLLSARAVSRVRAAGA